MMYLLDPSSQESAISLATALDAELEKVDLQVNGQQNNKLIIYSKFIKYLFCVPYFTIIMIIYILGKIRFTHERRNGAK